MNPEQVGISVAPRFIPEQSNPQTRKYFFSYTITIVNRGDESCQLLSRYWLITDGEGTEQEVRGEGVIGQQPHLAAGESFTYTSGVQLDTPVGTMQGYYKMLGQGKELFEVAIEPFLLAQPGAIN